jgi:hypothetical protein
MVEMSRNKYIIVDAFGTTLVMLQMLFGVRSPRTASNRKPKRSVLNVTRV